jgi:hypothetical protein
MKTKRKIRATVTHQPFAVPIEMRPLWRICLILISIAVVGRENNYVDVQKINILVWMLTRKSKWDTYESYLLDRTSSVPLVSVDTATYRAIEFSRAKEFIIIQGKRLYITETGRGIFDLLVQNGIMLDEREFLASLGKKLTDKKVKSLIGGSA